MRPVQFLQTATTFLILSCCAYSQPSPKWFTGTRKDANAPLPQTAAPTVFPNGGMGFIPKSPCRVVDTRLAQGDPSGVIGGPFLAGFSTRDFAIPSGPCGIPASAGAYALNVTVVPHGILGFLAIWAAGQPQPPTSTLNSLDGRIVANFALVQAGTNGAVSVYVTDDTDVIIDVEGYFDATDPNGLAFLPAWPCRLFDTREGTSPVQKISPFTPVTFSLVGLKCHESGDVFPGAQIYFPVAKAFWVNATVVPTGNLGYLTLWGGGEPVPPTSTLNSDGRIVANSAIVKSDPVSVLSSGSTDLILDAIGYFEPPGSVSVAGEGYFHPIAPCRALDTRHPPSPFYGTVLAGQTRNLTLGNCPVLGTFYEVSMNVTAIPKNGRLTYLTLTTGLDSAPRVSTLNSPNGTVVSAATATFFGDLGGLQVYSTDDVDVIIDINGYFMP